MTEISKDMSEAEIKQMTDLILQNKPAGEWKGEITNLTAQIQSLEQQLWQLGTQIVQMRKRVCCARNMEEENE